MSSINGCSFIEVFFNFKMNTTNDNGCPQLWKINGSVVSDSVIIYHIGIPAVEVRHKSYTSKIIYLHSHIPKIFEYVPWLDETPSVPILTVAYVNYLVNCPGEHHLTPPVTKEGMWQDIVN